jgi:hypothetical protein
MKKFSLLLTAAFLTIALSPQAAHAFAFATVTWGSAQNITGDSDVSTLGTLLYAYNAGDAGVTATTVNGVNFSPFVFPNGETNTTTGPVLFTENPGLLWSSNSLGVGSAPFATLSADYQTLLSSGGSANNPGTLTGIMAGLTVGRDYLIQWWSNDSSLSGNFDQTQDTRPGGGSTVTLDSNTADSVGGLGQYAIGTFTATGTPLAVLNLDGIAGIAGLPLINAFQIRDVTSAAVPEPGQVAASLLLLAGIGGYIFLKRRQAAKAATA